MDYRGARLDYYAGRRALQIYSRQAGIYRHSGSGRSREEGSKPLIGLVGMVRGPANSVHYVLDVGRGVQVSVCGRRAGNG